MKKRPQKAKSVGILYEIKKKESISIPKKGSTKIVNDIENSELKNKIMNALRST